MMNRWWRVNRKGKCLTRGCKIYTIQKQRSLKWYFESMKGLLNHSSPLIECGWFTRPRISHRSEGNSISNWWPLTLEGPFLELLLTVTQPVIWFTLSWKWQLYYNDMLIDSQTLEINKRHSMYWWDQHLQILIQMCRCDPNVLVRSACTGVIFLCWCDLVIMVWSGCVCIIWMWRCDLEMQMWYWYVIWKCICDIDM